MAAFDSLFRNTALTVGCAATLLALPIRVVAEEQADPKEPAKAGRFVSLRPLGLEELYAKRMRFTDGEPNISVGIMDGQKSVLLRADGPTRLMFEEGSVPKTSYAPPATAYSFRVLSSTPAKLRYWAVVATFDYEAWTEEAEQEQKSWEKRGFETKVFVVGTIVALKGNVLDTRERHLAIGGYTIKKKTDALMSRLSLKENIRTFVHEELIEPPHGVITVHDDQGRLLHRAKDSVYFGTVEGGLVEVSDVEHGRGYASHGRQTRKYWGHLYVVVDRDGRLAVVNSVLAERLLGGLVPAEIFATAPMEALKAQAVTARGEIFSKLALRHFGEPFHLCSEQHCQVYAGAGYERPETNKSVEATRGLLAVRPRKGGEKRMRLVDSVYSSTCGGYSEANEIVWDTAVSASLRPRIDGMANDPALSPFAKGLDASNIRAWVESYPPTECARSSFVAPHKFRWKKTLSGAALGKMVRKLGVGAVKDIQILGRGQGGRVTGVRIVGTAKSSDVLRELPVRRLFGNLNSGMFVLDLERSRAGLVTSVTFTGGGWGHGVGMCQVGAIGRAERNQTFEQILSHYYSGAVVERIY